MIDTHSHIYSEEFDNDLPDVMLRAKSVGIDHIILPNVDTESIERLHQTESQYKGFCHAAMGLHPTSVDADYKTSLATIESYIKQRPYVAIGEIGIDLYWDKTFLTEQIYVFEQQLEWAMQYGYPVIIHMRDSYDEIMNCLNAFSNRGLRGIFHSFMGTLEQAHEILTLGGFKLGINGVITFKNSGLDKVVSQLSIHDLVLETDAPYLTPTPHRGKRNESSYITLVAQKLSEIYSLPITDIDKITTENTRLIFPAVLDTIED